jgi:hypothetical protein
VVRHLPIYTIETKLRRPFRTNIRDSAQQARRFDFFAIQAMQRLIHHEWGPAPHINNVNLTGVVG